MSPIRRVPAGNQSAALPVDRLQAVEGWGMLSRSMGYVYRPSTALGIREVFDLARRSSRSVVPRGTGYSYGDTSLNSENIVLDLTRMDRILDWDPASGLIRLEPGVTVRRLWQYVIEDGWWPAVVPGAMRPTLAGCAAVNAHGKNNWRAGSILDCIESFELMLPSGELVACTPSLNPELFHAAIGGLGMLGVFTGLTLRLRRITSGLLRVRQRVASNLAEMFAIFEDEAEGADDLVGWIDAFTGGSALGRGLVQAASYVHDDPNPCRTLRAGFQDLGDTLFGVVPRSQLWRAMKPTVNDTAMRLLNGTRYQIGVRQDGAVRDVPLAQFHFFHDYVPNWKQAWKPGGILQYQVFVPRLQAFSLFQALLAECQAAGLIPYLAVFKRHRADSALLSYSVDGYSMSLDFHEVAANERKLRHMLEGLTHQHVLPAGGRFYPAKDSVLDAQSAARSFTARAVDRFLALKGEVDPDEILQSDLYRRVFRPAGAFRLHDGVDRVQTPVLE